LWHDISMTLFEVAEEKKSKTDLKEIAKYLVEASIFSIDLETSGFDIFEDHITIVSVACKVNDEIKGWAIETREHPISEIAEAFFKIFHDSTKTVVFHNAPFDVKFLNRAGVYFTCRIADTMIMLWLNDEDRIRNRGYGLKDNVLKFLNHKMSSFEEARSLFGDFEKYACDDAVQTLRLFYFLEEKLKQFKLLDWMWNVEMPIVRVLIETETRGVALDKGQLKKLKTEAFASIDKLEKAIHVLAGYKFDIGSPKQCAKLLFLENKFGMRPDGSNQFSNQGKSGDWSTSDDVLKAMAREKIELAKQLLEFRRVNTLLNVFIKPLLERCINEPYIIFPKFIQTGTVSGRLASKDPNFQNLPRKGGIRRTFIARKKYKIVKSDYSQAELRLMAHMSQDPIMIDIYRNNGDIHQTTADACGISRQAAKCVNFGLIYRMSALRLQAQLAAEGVIISKEEAQDYINKYFRTYKCVRKYHQLVDKTVRQRLRENGEYGYVKTLGGRYRRLDRSFLEGKETGFSAITQAINTTIQGGVSDLIKIAMVDCQNIFRANGWLDPEHGVWDAYILGQIHDELLVECREDLAEKVAQITSYCMENAGRKYKICVPMTAEAKIVNHLDKE